MTIKPDLVYSIKEASSILSVNPRKLARIGLKYNIKKVDNRYIFGGYFLINYFNLDVKTPMSESVLKMSKDVLKLDTDEPKTNQLDLEVESLKAEIKELKEQLAEYDISQNERIEVFTNEDYAIFETRLKEWFTLQKELEHKEELFNVEKMSLTEMLEHYKNQFEYQKKQSEKILQMHQKLIDTIDKQNSLAIQRNIIEAKEKDVINKDWKPKKN